MTFLRYMPESPPPPGVGRSRERWALARADYLAGGSAPEICERHGLSLSTFRWRARNEGWRRVDQPETSPDAPFVDEGRDVDPAAQPEDPLAPSDPDHELATPTQLADIAWANVERAVRRGRLIEARGWTRLHRDLRATQRPRPDQGPSAAERALNKSIDDLAAMTKALWSDQDAPP